MYRYVFVLLLITGVNVRAQDVLTLSSNSADAGGSTDVALSLISNQATDSALQWTLTYSPADITSLVVTSGPALLAAGKSLTCNPVPGSYVCEVSGMNSVGMQSGVIATVELTLDPNLTTSANIGVENTVAVSSAGDALPMSGSGGTITVNGPLTPIAGETVTTVPQSVVVLSPPSISSVSPNPVKAGVGLQTILVTGTAFQNGADLKVQLTSGGSQIEVAGSQLMFLSSTQLSISVDVGTAEAIWTTTVINPDTQASNVFAFPVVASDQTSFALPQFTFGGAWYTALYLANPTNFPARIQVHFFGDDGTPLGVPLLGIGAVSSRTIDLNPHSTVVLEALSGGTNQEGWAEVTMPAGAIGYAVFRQTIADRPDQEAVVPLTPENRKTADLTYDDVLFTTAVGFVNPTNLAETVTITAFAANGVSSGTTRVVVNPRSKISNALKAIAGLGNIAGNRGRVVFSVSSGAISVLGLRFGGSAFTSIPAVHRPASSVSGPISYVLPQLVFNGAWYTALYFSNTTDAPLTVPVSFISDSGSPLNSPLAGVGPVTSRTVALDPGATAILEFVADSANTVLNGWAEARLPPGVTGYAVFRQTVAGRPDQEAVVPLTSESSQSSDIIYDDILFTTAIAFLNPGDQETTVTATVYSANGTQLGVAQIPLAPHAKIAPLLKDVPGFSGISGNRGWATFSVPTGDVSILGLRFGGSAFTSIPVTGR